MIDRGICDKWFIWNPSKCECESDKSCDKGKCLDYENFKCRKKPVDKLVKRCSGNIDGNKMMYNNTLGDYGKACNSCTIDFVLFVIAFLIIIGISSVFVYSHWYLKTRYIETAIY